ncbi:phage head closure protein [Salibacterium lacus]|uniref:Phage head closure protein n=1 Tax=Salibacterium lacus TaxID=1898109 RepID=A0ABW5T0F5_9BACI
MRYNDVIYLISKTIEYDDYGNPIEKPIKRKVYANRMRVTTSERYEAGQQGLKPSKRFEIYSFEYDGETSLKHKDTTYNVMDVDERGDKLQLVCDKDVGT